MGWLAAGLLNKILARCSARLHLTRQPAGINQRNFFWIAQSKEGGKMEVSVLVGNIPI